MRRRALFSQVVAVNVTLICAAALAAGLLTGLDLAETGKVLAVIGVAALLGLLANLVLLRARFTPLERLIEDMEKVDLSRPRAKVPTSIDGRGETAEVERIELAYLRMLRRLEAERRRSSSAALRAQEEERARVARDLHDEVNQSLTAILLRLEATNQSAPPGVAEELAEVKRLVNQAMGELLTLARQLRPSALDDHGLTSAIVSQVRRFSAQTGIRADVRTDGEPEGLESDQEIAAYRFAQEALSNIAQHADATHVEVDLSANGHKLELSVRDDGRGFDPAVESDHGGIGLAGMAERARLVVARLEVDSRPGGGTSLTLQVP
jgi:two-component system sensor histidine kinase UhpB